MRKELYEYLNELIYQVFSFVPISLLVSLIGKFCEDILFFFLEIQILQSEMWYFYM